MPFQADAFQNSAFQIVAGPASGTIAAAFSPSFVGAATGVVRISGTATASFSPTFTAAVAAAVKITGTLAATNHFAFTAALTGTSEGNIIVIPRDADNGTEYLVEMTAIDLVTSLQTTLYFSKYGFNSLPTDVPAETPYYERLKTPGNYDRSMFSTGTTSGEITAGAGLIEFINNDGALDYLRGYAFDGYPLKIRAIPALEKNLDNVVTVFTGTIEQVELSWTRATARMRDRLAEIATAIQDVLYLGTTIAGGMSEAEGTPDDLKDKQKPKAFGAVPQVAGVNSNKFDLIYDFGQNGVASFAEVRDKGSPLTYTGTNYATTAALIAGTVAPGSYSTCIVTGQVGLGSTPIGQITAAPLEGANSAARTAAQIARRMLLAKGYVEGVSFLTADITKLDTLNSSVVGYWTDTEEVLALDAIAAVLGSIGATISPDRLGVFRMFRFQPPTGFPKAILTRAEILDSSGKGFQLLATGDEGKGVPAWKVSVNYRHNGAVASRTDLAAGVSEDYITFAAQEWRTEVAKNDAVKTIHKLAPELKYDTYLTTQADAQAEAARRLALHSVPRDRFQVPVKSFLVEQVDMGDPVRLKVNRFGLDAGKDFTVIGITENLETQITTLDLWG